MVGLRIIRWNITFRVAGDIVAGVAHHLIFGYCPSPVDPPLMVSGADISFSNHHTHIAYLKYDHRVGIIAYTQNVTNFYILIWKFACRIHSCFQLAKCCIAEYKCKGHTAHGTDIRSVKRSPLPVIIISGCIGIRLIIGPGRSFLISVIILQRNHTLIDFRRGRDCTVSCSHQGQRIVQWTDQLHRSRTAARSCFGKNILSRRRCGRWLRHNGRLRTRPRHLRSFRWKNILFR